MIALLTLAAGVLALAVLLVRLDAIARADEARRGRAGNTTPSDLTVGGRARGGEAAPESNTVPEE